MQFLVAGLVPVLLVVQLGRATVTGVVRDADTGDPLVGAAVTLPDLQRITFTDVYGRYELPEVPAGPQHLTFRLLGHAPRTMHALVPRDGQLAIHVALRPEPLRLHTVEVRPRVIMRGAEGPDSTVFPDRASSAAAVRNHPTLSEPDVFQVLSGGEVVVGAESPTGVHLRGGSSDHTAYALDGVPVFSPYHAAGVFSAWNPDALSQVRLSSCSATPDGPQALSGVVHGSTRSPGSEFHAQGSFSSSHARITLDGPLGGSGLGFLGSLRTGYPGAFAPEGDPTYVRGRTGDGLFKVQGSLLGGGAQILYYDTRNRIDAAARVRPAPGSSEAGLRNVFEWDSRSAGVLWQREVSAGSLRLQAWGAAGDADCSWAPDSIRLDLRATRRDAGILAVLERRTPGRASAAGIRIERSATSYLLLADSASSPTLRLRAVTPVASAFVRHERDLGEHMVLDAGTSLATTAGAFYLAPRGSLRWTVSPRWTLSGHVARMHQFSQSLRNTESVVGNVFPAELFLGSGASGVPVARSDQAVVGVDFRPSSGAHLGVQAYARDFDELLLVAPRVGEPFTTGAFAIGGGTSRGVSIDAALSTARFGIVGSYGLQRVRFEFGDSSYVPAHGTTHLLEGGVNFYPTATASIRLGAAAALGRRTTTIAGGFEWEASNLQDLGSEFAGSPRYDGEILGGTPLPAYVRLDLGVRKHWHVRTGGRDTSIEIHGTVTNLLQRRNLLTYARDPATGERTGIEMRARSPIVVGLDWRF